MSRVRKDIDELTTTLERVGDAALYTDKRDEALVAHSTALLLGPTNLNSVLTKWARMMLSSYSPADDALRAATKVCSLQCPEDGS